MSVLRGRYSELVRAGFCYADAVLELARQLDLDRDTIKRTLVRAGIRPPSIEDRAPKEREKR